MKKAPSLLLRFFFLIATHASAADIEDVRLIVSPPNPVAGQEISLDLQVGKLPEVYGAELELRYDPSVIELVDADSNKAGIQASIGSIWKDQPQFLLQNEGDNKKGSLAVALSLLAPAQPLTKGGSLMQAKFRTLKAGSADLRLMKLRFGDSTGQLYEGETESLPELVVYSSEKAIPSRLVSLPLGLVVTASLLVLFFILMLARRRKGRAPAAIS